MLKLWTSAKAYSLDQTVGPPLSRSKIKHKFVEYREPYVHAKKRRVPIPDAKKGEVCLVMGTKCVESLKLAGLLPKQMGIGKLREKPYPAPGGGSYLVTYDPGIVAIDYGRKPEIQWDVNLGVRLIRTGSVNPQYGDYKYVDTFAPLITYIRKQYKKTGKAIHVSCDLETVGLDPVNPDAHIVSIGFSVYKGMAHVKYFSNRGEYPEGMLLYQLKYLLKSKRIKLVGANFKYDWHWIKKHWDIECTNFALDTLLVGSLLDENRNNSLNMHTKIYLPSLGGYDDEFNRTHDKGKMHEVPTLELLPYAGGDLDADLQLVGRLRPIILKDKRLANFYGHLLHPASKAFTRIEQRGMVVDIERYEELRHDVQKQMDSLHKTAIGILPATIQNKYIDDLSLTRDVILREFLFTNRGLNLRPKVFTEKEKLPSTSKTHLQMFLGNPKADEFLQALFEWKAAKKTMSTYIVGFLKHLRADGMFHPTYMLHRGMFDGDTSKEAGTVTGRSSCKDPAYQTIPKHTKWAKLLRSVYTAPPGYVILNVDFQQGELRIAACLANEITMINAYKKGIDLHLLTRLELWNIQNPASALTLKEAMALMKAEDPNIKLVRQGGKAGNFGLLYGMQVLGFLSYAWNTYGVKLTEDEGANFRNGFFNRYPRLPDWHDNYISMAHAHGQVRSPLGRIRHLPLVHSNDWKVRSAAERQGINAPVQSTLSDMGLLAAGILNEKYPDLWCFGFTHDALSFYVPEDEAHEWAVKISAVMENLPLAKFGWKPQLSFPVDVEVGTNMGDMKGLTLAA